MIHPDVAVALEPVVAALSQLNVAYYLCGSLASSALGEPRSTLDADLVADLREDQVDLLVGILGDAFYADADAMREAIQMRSSFNLIHQATFLKVDVFAPKARAFDQEQLKRRQARTLEARANAPQIFVASAEDVLLAKLEWFRMGGETSERQWRDVLGVMKVQDDLLDLAYLRHWAREIKVDDLLERALDEAGLRSS